MFNCPNWLALTALVLGFIFEGCGFCFSLEGVRWVVPQIVCFPSSPLFKSAMVTNVGTVAR